MAIYFEISTDLYYDVPLHAEISFHFHIARENRRVMYSPLIRCVILLGLDIYRAQAYQC